MFQCLFYYSFERDVWSLPSEGDSAINAFSKPLSQKIRIVIMHSMSNPNLNAYHLKSVLRLNNPAPLAFYRLTHEKLNSRKKTHITVYIVNCRSQRLIWPKNPYVCRRFSKKHNSRRFPFERIDRPDRASNSVFKLTPFEDDIYSSRRMRGIIMETEGSGRTVLI